MKKITVVIGTDGNRDLTQTLESVFAQMSKDYDLSVNVIYDGPIDGKKTDISGVIKTTLPCNTGRGGNCAHRVYAAASWMWLDNCDFLTFLDDDNEMLPDHLASMYTRAMASQGFSWSLRCVTDGCETVHDNCESLGPWPSIEPFAGHNLIDTNCWLMSPRLWLEVNHNWLSPIADRVHTSSFIHSTEVDLASACTGRHSLKYKLGGFNQLQLEPFKEGNQTAHQMYPDGFPWTANR